MSPSASMSASSTQYGLLVEVEMSCWVNVGVVAPLFAYLLKKLSRQPPTYKDLRQRTATPFGGPSTSHERARHNH